MQPWRAWGVLVLLMVGCTSPNPRSCADGACTDPSLPYCDLDGAVGGTPDTCIAVTCTPNEHAACRADIAVRCNAAGTNYDLVECELGCSDAIGGCAACTGDDDCNNPMPVCDASACRGCRTDDECASHVCELDTGRCLVASEVQYASAGGPDSGSCSSTAPCSLPHAVAQASGDPLRSTVRVAPGRYTRELIVSTGAVKIVGTSTSVLAGEDPVGSLIQVDVGASLFVRGLRFELLRDTISCGSISATSQFAALELNDVVIDTLRTGMNVNPRCNATLRRVNIVGASTIESVAAISAGREATLDADVLRVATTTAMPAYVSFSSSSTVRITNAVFANSEVLVAQQAAVTLAYSTVVFGSSGGLRDTGSLGVTAENNVLVSSGMSLQCGICTNAKNNIVFPQAAPAASASNTIADPQLLDPSAGDYHLRATSPALNAATPSASLMTDHDYDGVSRPQGAAPDIGAFERAP